MKVFQELEKGLGHLSVISSRDRLIMFSRKGLRFTITQANIHVQAKTPLEGQEQSHFESKSSFRVVQCLVNFMHI